MDKKIFKSYWHRKKDYQITPAEKVKRLILGDSHAVYGVYTEHRTPYTFNAAEISADLFTIFHIGKSCLAKFPHLEQIVCVYSPYFNGFDLSKCSEKWRCVCLRLALGVPLRKLPLRILARIFRKMIINAWPDSYTGNAYGWVAPSDFWPTAIQRAEGHYRLATKYGKAELAYLSKLKELCEKTKKSLLVVFPPARKDYKEVIDNLMGGGDIFQSFYDEFGQDIPVLDLYHCDLFTDLDFGDIDHMNKQGAVKMAELIENYWEKK